jgi:hypothetical protein
MGSGSIGVRSRGMTVVDALMVNELIFEVEQVRLVLR